MRPRRTAIALFTATALALLPCSAAVAGARIGVVPPGDAVDGVEPSDAAEPPESPRDADPAEDAARPDDDPEIDESPPKEDTPPPPQVEPDRDTDPVDEDDDASEPAREDDELPPLTKLQTAGWWTLFGSFALGTTAGVFAGLAERQEDRALRLATSLDSQTNAQPLYEDHQDDYETYLRRGRAYQRTAIGLAAVTGAVVIAGITLFAVDAARRRAGRDGRRARMQIKPGLGSWEMRF